MASEACFGAVEQFFSIQLAEAVLVDLPYMRTVLTFTSADGDVRCGRRMVVNVS